MNFERKSYFSMLILFVIVSSTLYMAKQGNADILQQDDNLGYFDLIKDAFELTYEEIEL